MVSSVGVREKVCVVGCGHVGLPLAITLAENFAVSGVDVNDRIIEMVGQGRLPFLEEGGEEILARVKSNLAMTKSLAEGVKGASAVILTLGTPLDENLNPNLGYIDGVLDRLFPILERGQLLVLRSTISPGTTAYVHERMRRELKYAVGKEVFLAYCPERIAEGFAFKELREIPQLVGSFDEESSRRAKALFGKMTRDVYVSKPANVELAKLFCNVYRYINFAISNEFMMVADKHGADIYEVVDLVNRNYLRGGLKKPGLTAGTCLFKDHFFVTERIPFAELGLAAWRINEGTPAFLVERVAKSVNLRGAKVCVLGLAFKRDVDDLRDSLSFKLLKQLRHLNADVVTHDPFVPEKSTDVFSPGHRGLYDAVFIATNHSLYDEKREAIIALAKPGGVIADVWDVLGTGRVVFDAAAVGVGRK